MTEPREDDSIIWGPPDNQPHDVGGLLRGYEPSVAPQPGVLNSATHGYQAEEGVADVPQPATEAQGPVAEAVATGGVERWESLATKHSGLFGDPDALAILVEPAQQEGVYNRLVAAGELFSRAAAVRDESLAADARSIVGSEQVVSEAAQAVERGRQAAEEYLGAAENWYGQLRENVIVHLGQFESTPKEFSAIQSDITDIRARLASGVALTPDDWRQLHSIEGRLANAATTYDAERKEATGATTADESIAQASAGATEQCAEAIRSEIEGIDTAAEIRPVAPDVSTVPQTVARVQGRVRTLGTPEAELDVATYVASCREAVDTERGKLTEFQSGLTALTPDVEGVIEQLTEVNRVLGDMSADRDELGLATTILGEIVAAADASRLHGILERVSIVVGPIIGRATTVQDLRRDMLDPVAYTIPDKLGAMRRQAAFGGWKA